MYLFGFEKLGSPRLCNLSFLNLRVESRMSGKLEGIVVEQNTEKSNHSNSKIIQVNVLQKLPKLKICCCHKSSFRYGILSFGYMNKGEADFLSLVMD